MIGLDTPAGRALSNAHTAALSAAGLIECARARLKSAMPDGNPGTVRALHDTLVALDAAVCKANLTAQRISDAGIG